MYINNGDGGNLDEAGSAWQIQWGFLFLAKAFLYLVDT